jgi:eukaryotic-like serine/threonine-protein kinase
LLVSGLPVDIPPVEIELPRLSDLRLVERLATENVADVFTGIQEPLGRSVLVKLLRPNVLPTSPFAAALEREARLLGELSHPYIQRLYDYRREDTRMWLVLEQLEGPTLEMVIRQYGHISTTAAVSIGLMLGSALAHCHERGIVHRDIQPRHITLTAEGRVVLTHFSGALKERLPTAPELLNGCDRPVIVPYLSPEQILGESTDGRTDIYSLGCVLYEALTGLNPFASTDERGVAQRIRHSSPVPPSRQQPGLPSGIDRIIQRCLEKLPSDRYADATEFKEVLGPMLRQLGAENPEAALSSELRNLGIFATPIRHTVLHSRQANGEKQGNLGRTVAVLGACSLLIIASGFVAQRNGTRTPLSARFTGPLQLRPDRAGYLRVVADPWAKVTIDGQYFDTTPIARSIPLPAGTHYVQLDHPQANTEKRVINIAVGETVLLDVRMKVPDSGRVDAGAPNQSTQTSADSSP